MIKIKRVRRSVLFTVAVIMSSVVFVGTSIGTDWTALIGQSQERLRNEIESKLKKLRVGSRNVDPILKDVAPYIAALYLKRATNRSLSGTPWKNIIGQFDGALRELGSTRDTESGLTIEEKGDLYVTHAMLERVPSLDACETIRKTAQFPEKWGLGTNQKASFVFNATASYPYGETALQTLFLAKAAQMFPDDSVIQEKFKISWQQFQKTTYANDPTKRMDDEKALNQFKDKWGNSANVGIRKILASSSRLRTLVGVSDAQNQKVLALGLQALENDASKFTSRGKGIGGSNGHTAGLAFELSFLPPNRAAAIAKQFRGSIFQHTGGKYNSHVPYWPGRGGRKENPRAGAPRASTFVMSQFLNLGWQPDSMLEGMFQIASDFSLRQSVYLAHVAREGVHQGKDQVAPYYWAPNLPGLSFVLSVLRQATPKHPQARQYVDLMQTFMNKSIGVFKTDWGGLSLNAGPRTYGRYPKAMTSMMAMALVPECEAQRGNPNSFGIYDAVMTEKQKRSVQDREYPQLSGLFGKQKKIQLAGSKLKERSFDDIAKNSHAGPKGSHDIDIQSGGKQPKRPSWNNESPNQLATKLAQLYQTQGATAVANLLKANGVDRNQFLQLASRLGWNSSEPRVSNILAALSAPPPQKVPPVDPAQVKQLAKILFSNQYFKDDFIHDRTQELFNAVNDPERLRELLMGYGLERQHGERKQLRDQLSDGLLKSKFSGSAKQIASTMHGILDNITAGKTSDPSLKAEVQRNIDWNKKLRQGDPAWIRSQIDKYGRDYLVRWAQGILNRGPTDLEKDTANRVLKMALDTPHKQEAGKIRGKLYLKSSAPLRLGKDLVKHNSLALDLDTHSDLGAQLNKFLPAGDAWQQIEFLSANDKLGHNNPPFPIESRNTYRLDVNGTPVSRYFWDIQKDIDHTYDRMRKLTGPSGAKRIAFSDPNEIPSWLRMNFFPHSVWSQLSESNRRSVEDSLKKLTDPNFSFDKNKASLDKLIDLGKKNTQLAKAVPDLIEAIQNLHRSGSLKTPKTKETPKKELSKNKSNPVIGKSIPFNEFKKRILAIDRTKKDWGAEFKKKLDELIAYSQRYPKHKQLAADYIVEALADEKLNPIVNSKFSMVLESLTKANKVADADPSKQNEKSKEASDNPKDSMSPVDWTLANLLEGELSKLSENKRTKLRSLLGLLTTKKQARPKFRSHLDNLIEMGKKELKSDVIPRTVLQALDRFYWDPSGHFDLQRFDLNDRLRGLGTPPPTRDLANDSDHGKQIPPAPPAGQSKKGPSKNWDNPGKQIPPAPPKNKHAKGNSQKLPGKSKTPPPPPPKNIGSNDLKQKLLDDISQLLGKQRDWFGDKSKQGKGLGKSGSGSDPNGNSSHEKADPHQLASATTKCASCHQAHDSTRPASRKRFSKEMKTAKGLQDHLKFMSKSLLDNMLQRATLTDKEKHAVQTHAKAKESPPRQEFPPRSGLKSQMPTCYKSMEENTRDIQSLPNNLATSSMGQTLQRAKANGKILFYDEKSVPITWQGDSAGRRFDKDSVVYASLMHKKRRTNGSSVHETGYPMDGGTDYPWLKTAGYLLKMANASASKFIVPPPSGGPFAKLRHRSYAKDGKNYFSRSVNVWGKKLGWDFNPGTIVGEVLKVAGLVFEVRMRQKQSDGSWKMDVLRPFRNGPELASGIRKLCNGPSAPSGCAAINATTIAKIENPSLTSRGRTHYVNSKSFETGKFTPLQLNTEALKGILSQANSHELPNLPKDVVTQLLKNTPFQSVMGTQWANNSWAPTTHSSKLNIVPQNYFGSHLAMTQQNCMNCHNSAGKHVDPFTPARNQMYAPWARDAPRARTWYGSVRGNDGILSWHPFSRTAVAGGHLASPNSVDSCLTRNGLVAGL